jgi:hypothetical protein
VRKSRGCSILPLAPEAVLTQLRLVETSRISCPIAREDLDRPRVYGTVRRLGSSKFAEQNQDQDDNEDEAEPTTTIVAGPIERTATEPAKAPKQRDNQNNE